MAPATSPFNVCSFAFPAAYDSSLKPSCLKSIVLSPFNQPSSHVFSPISSNYQLRHSIANILPAAGVTVKNEQHSPIPKQSGFEALNSNAQLIQAFDINVQPSSSPSRSMCLAPPSPLPRSTYTTSMAIDSNHTQTPYSPRPGNYPQGVISVPEKSDISSVTCTMPVKFLIPVALTMFPDKTSSFSVVHSSAAVCLVPNSAGQRTFSNEMHETSDTLQQFQVAPSYLSAQNICIMEQQQPVSTKVGPAHSAL